MLDSQNYIRVGQTVETVSVSVGQPKLYPVETVSVLGQAVKAVSVLRHNENVLDRQSKLYPCRTDCRNTVYVWDRLSKLYLCLTVETPYLSWIGCFGNSIDLRLTNSQNRAPYLCCKAGSRNCIDLRLTDNPNAVSVLDRLSKLYRSTLDRQPKYSQ